MVFNSFFDKILGPLINWNPLYGLLIISFILTLIITILYKLLTDQEMIKGLKKEMKDHQEEMKKNKGNTEKIIEIQKKSMEKSMKLMMHSLKPTLYTFIPIIIVFGYLSSSYKDKGALIFGLGWIWVYIISSIIFSTILRKVLKAH